MVDDNRPGILPELVVFCGVYFPVNNISDGPVNHQGSAIRGVSLTVCSGTTAHTKKPGEPAEETLAMRVRFSSVNSSPWTISMNSTKAIAEVVPIQKCVHQPVENTHVG